MYYVFTTATTKKVQYLNRNFWLIISVCLRWSNQDVFHGSRCAFDLYGCWWAKQRLEWWSASIWYGQIQFASCCMCCIIRATSLYEIHTGKLMGGHLNWKWSCFNGIFIFLGGSSSTLAANSCDQCFTICGSHHGTH